MDVQVNGGGYSHGPMLRTKLAQQIGPKDEKNNNFELRKGSCFLHPSLLNTPHY